MKNTGVHKITYAKYELKKGLVLKDGHTMMSQDIVSDLNRKSYLEERSTELLERYNEAVEALKDNQYILDFAANIVRKCDAQQEKNGDNWTIGESLQERIILNNELI
jgi:chorismate mutase